MRLIDADALVEAVKDYPYGFRGMIVCDIAKQPTIDPVRHGYWKETDDPMFRACSVCGYLEWRGLWNNYCPECGTKMDGGTDETD